MCWVLLIHWLTNTAPITRKDLEKVGQLYSRGEANGTPFEELVLVMDRKLRRLQERIGKLNKNDKIDRIARLINQVTIGLSVNEVLTYLGSPGGDAWSEY